MCRFLSLLESDERPFVFLLFPGDSSQTSTLDSAKGSDVSTDVTSVRVSLLFPGDSSQTPTLDSAKGSDVSTDITSVRVSLLFPGDSSQTPTLDSAKGSPFTMFLLFSGVSS